MVKYIIYGLYICLFICLLISWIRIKIKEKELVKKEYQNYKKKKEKEINNINRYYKIEEEKIKKAFEEKQQIYNESIKLTKSIIKEEEEKKNLILSQKSEIIEKELNEIKIQRENLLENEFHQKVLEFNEQLNNYKKEKEEEREELEKEFKKIKGEIEEYRKKRESINAAILREKELQEKEDFYKINITEDDIKDIELLKTIEPKIKNREAINKLIFDVYISKPMKEMIKRVLSGKSPSGIYKITYLPTGESYIGKAVSVDKRWTEHCKAAYSLSNIAHSSLHTKMAKDGVWNFSFELLEEVPKENLTTREKYYIMLYDTKNTGLNERLG